MRTSLIAAALVGTGLTIVLAGKDYGRPFYDPTAIDPIPVAYGLSVTGGAAVAYMPATVVGEEIPVRVAQNRDRDGKILWEYI